MCFYQLLSKSKCFLRQTHSLPSLSFLSVRSGYSSLYRHPCDTEHDFGVKHCTHKITLAIIYCQCHCVRAVGRSICACACVIRMLFSKSMQIFASFFWVNRNSHFASLPHTHQCFVFGPLCSLLRTFLLLDSNQINFRW